MRIPIIPLAVAGTLVGVVVYLFNSAASGDRKMTQPRLSVLVDVDGDETEVAVAPDGSRLVAVSSGDLWLVNLADKSRTRLTETREAESFPAWAPDGKRLTFTRGGDTYQSSGPDFSSPQLLRENATSLSWAASGRMVFVRDRALWITDAAGINDRALVGADPNAEISIRNPRFSPDTLQIAYVSTNLGLQGEVWTADATTGATKSLVADRWSENPLDVGWLADGKQLVYLTNRSGAIALWIIDFAQNTLGPLTGPLDGVQLGRTGIAVWQDEIFLPRHGVNSDIVGSDGTTIASSPVPEFEPAASPDGRLVAYTIQRDNAFEVWTANADGSNAAFRAAGTQPQFSPNGFEIVYTHTDVEGHIDLRTVDIRDGSSETITDAGEIDFHPDWSPDGRTIAFSSGKSGSMALWSIARGGKRTRLNDSGYFPRFSADGESLAFWSQGAIWSSDKNGARAKRLMDSPELEPVPPVWLKGKVTTYRDADIGAGREILPAVDVFPDGRVLSAVLTTKATALWTVTLTYEP
jgi:Tol biopolymer transport system component